MEYTQEEIEDFILDDVEWDEYEIKEFEDLLDDWDSIDDVGDYDRYEEE